MRAFGFIVLSLALSCGSAAALETSAGTDTVNASQVGLNAKIEAGNAAITGTINQIMACGRGGELYDSVAHTCVSVDEPLAKKIAACTTNKTWYNQSTGACMPSAPDLTASVTSTQALLTKILNCNANKQFYSQATDSCVAGGAATVKHILLTNPHSSGVASIPGCSNQKFGTYDLCYQGSFSKMVIGTTKDYDSCTLNGMWFYDASNKTSEGGMVARVGTQWVLRQQGTSLFAASVDCYKF
jgi:hypothetical protein